MAYRSNSTTGSPENLLITGLTGVSASPLVIDVTAQGQILAVGFQAMTQIDRDTGEVVIISNEVGDGLESLAF